MRKMSLFALAFLPVLAHAGGLELSVGKTARTKELSYSIGYTGSIYGLRARFGYANLGTPTINLNVSPDDYADDMQAGWGTPPCYWLQPIAIKEIYGTLDPKLYGNFRFEIGAALYHSQWQQDICQNWYNESPHAYGNRPNITPIVGLVYEAGQTDFVMSWQDITGKGDWEGDNPKNNVVNFSIRRRF